MRTRCVLTPLVLVISLLGCGGSSGNSVGPGDGGSPGADAPSKDGPDAASTSDAATSPDGGSIALAARTGAVHQTIANNSYCTTLAAFYWEIGDVSGALVSGAVGSAFSATTVMSIASASKFVFGAYVVERFKADLSMIDLSAMRMLSGYTSFPIDGCAGTTTVSACLMAGKNGTYTAADLNHFYYNGGHFQKYATDLGLGGDDDTSLTSDIKALVGTEFSFTYGSPQLAGGIHTSASDYAAFLRKILAGKLAIHDHLGENAVCTLPSSCPSALYSPAPAAWHYSYAHWVEDDPTTGDGAFSSPGAFGFYPWIDATKTYYGIVARESTADKAYVQSAECGAVIRKAFVTAVAQ